MLTHATPSRSPQADFAYDVADDGAGLPARVAIFGADEGLRRQIAADLGGAGFRSIDGGSLRALLEGPIALLGDVVVVDCMVTGSRGIDGMMLAGLARLDMRVARSGAKLIVATNLDGLDDVFAVLDQSNPQILVSPSRAERVIAVGRVMGEAGAARLREMGEEDRVALLRLSQQVEAIAHSLDRLGRAPAAGGGSVFGEFRRDYTGAEPSALGSFGAPAPASDHPLPDPQLVRQIIANRQARAVLRSRTVRRSGVGHAARSHRRPWRRGAGLGHLAVHRGGCSGDNRAAVADADGRKRHLPAGPRSGRPPPRLHRPE